MLPFECREEIEADHAKIRDSATDSEKRKADAVIDKANLKKRTKKGNGAEKKKDGKRVKKETKSSKKQHSANKKSKDCNDKATWESSRIKPLLQDPGKWIIGKSIQICYVMEDLQRGREAATLIYRHRENTKDSTEEQSLSEKAVGDEEKMVCLATFRSWKKLSKRLKLWVFKYDPEDPHDLSVSEGGGFPRPQLLPMADIFRSPR